MGARSRCQWDRGRGECHLRWRAGRRHFRGSQSAAARDLRQRFPQRHPPQPRCRLTAPSLPPPHRPSLVPATDVWISAVSKASLGGTAWRCEGAQHNAGSGCGANTLAVKMLVPVEASPGGRGGGGGELAACALQHVQCCLCSAAARCARGAACCAAARAVLPRGACVVPPVRKRVTPAELAVVTGVCQTAVLCPTQLPLAARGRCCYFIFRWSTRASILKLCVLPCLVLLTCALPCRPSGTTTSSCAWSTRSPLASCGRSPSERFQGWPDSCSAGVVPWRQPARLCAHAWRMRCTAPCPGFAAGSAVHLRATCGKPEASVHACWFRRWQPATLLRTEQQTCVSV